ncbi:5032_t:CDS:10 [Funneliformis mosseae]|uniref:5032_t:CDS:1 n=1 Tax=Funneliformis mosseae TaxID=27381 RepID=A0A9N9F256_FUNMO|nr:5032_t:CDS:10 [Funneliformis mosseae]
MKLLIFAIFYIILFAILPVKSQLHTFTYYENASDPIIFSMETYDDNTIVIHIINANSSDTSDDNDDDLICVNRYLSFRTIYPDGSFESVNITLDIQDLNYCIRVIGDIFSPINIYAVRNNFLLVTYAVVTDVDDLTTYDERAMVLDLSGNIYSNASLGYAYFHPVTNKWLPNFAKITHNVNRDKGFLRFGRIANTNNSFWQQFMITDKGEIQLLAEGVIMFPEDYMSVILHAVAMMDGGYAVIYANTTNSIATPNDPIPPHGGVYAKLLPYGTNTDRHPIVLYQTQIPGLNFTSLDCSISYVGVGQSCILTGKFAFRAITNTFYTKIDFLSSGNVYNIQSLNATIPTNPEVDTYNVRSLPYGGYLLDGKGEQIIYGYLLNDTQVYNWDLDNPINGSIMDASVILPNNTFVFAQREETQNWSLSSMDLPKFAGNIDHGYGNLHINYTFPLVNDIIDETNIIKINYHNPIDLSNHNIIIFQNDRNIVRQNISGSDAKFVSLDDDGTTVIVNIIKSTFNRPGESYYVSIENGFVKSRQYQEPIIGLQNKAWFFTTQMKDEKSSDKITGRVRLTAEGTFVYESLDEDGRKDFYANLMRELAYAIPISQNRITTNGKFETDPSVSPKQIILSINIEKDKTKQERTVNLAVEDLNTLIENKPITLIGSGEFSKYLDQDYGYKFSRNFLREYGLTIIGVIAIIFVLLSFFFLAKRQNREAKNIAILQLGLIIFDLVLDILFASTKSMNVDGLFKPSIVFLVVPFIIGSVMAFNIIREEDRYDNFSKWSSENTKVVAIFTLLAGADIEALSMLESNVKIFGLDCFKAEFSKHSLRKIFFGACLNIFSEEIPQIIMQIIYFKNVVRYDLVPILTFSSSCINLVINIIGRVYKFKEHKWENTNHDTLFDNSDHDDGYDDDRNSGGSKDRNINKNSPIFLEEKEKNPSYLAMDKESLLPIYQVPLAFRQAPLRIKELEQQNIELQVQIQQNQQTISEQQSQINELYKISFPNSPYNFHKLKQDIIRLKVHELAPQVRNESTKLVQLITEAKKKSGNFSSIVDLILETQKQIVLNSETSQRDKLIGKIEAYQSILASNLVDKELQTLLDKQTEVLILEKHLESLQTEYVQLPSLSRYNSMSRK